MLDIATANSPNAYWAPKPLTIDGSAIEMSCLSGIPLNEWLKGDRDFTAKIHIALAIVDSLMEIHHRGLIHKHISADHCIIDGDKCGWVSFGASTQITRLRQKMTKPSQIDGDLKFISPEQTGRINRVLDWRGDLYSVGVMLYLVFAGRLPFYADTPMRWVAAHLNQPVPAIKAAIPEPLKELIYKLLEKKPEDRYASLEGLRHDLNRLLTEDQFELGAKDFPQFFSVPERLYGRDLPLAQLQQAIEKIGARAQFVSISAPSGMGKTVLVEEFGRSLKIDDLIIAHGKYDKYGSSIPYSAIAKAVNSICRTVLAFDKASFEVWRRRVLKALDGNGRLMTDLFESLEPILGEQPPVVEIGGEEAKERLEYTLLALLRAAASENSPVLFFLDDLQWADTSSLRIIREINNRADTFQSILFLMSYRSNEVQGSPLLVDLLAHFRNLGVLQEIFLEPLAQEHIRDFLVDGFGQRIATTELEPLVEFVESRSQGNPFFVKEIIETLISSNVIYLDFSVGYWHFSRDKAAQIEISDDVAELVTAKLANLHPEELQLLSIASYITGDFNLNDLALVSDKTPTECAHLLWHAVLQGYVIPLDQNYEQIKDGETAANVNAHLSFSHDKVRSACQDMVADAERLKLKHTISLRYLHSAPLTDLSSKVIAYTILLNETKDLLAEGDKKLYRQANLVSGQQAIKNASFDLGREFVKNAYEIYSDRWRTELYDESLAIINLYAICHAAEGDVEAITALHTEFRGFQKEVTENLTIILAAIDGYLNRRDYHGVIALIREELPAYGYDPIKKSNIISLLRSYRIARKSLTTDPDGAFRLLPSPDPKAIAVAKIMASSGPSYLTAYPDVYGEEVAHIVAYMLRFGIAADAGLAIFGFSLLTSTLGDLAYSDRLTKAICAYVQDLGDQGSVAASVPVARVIAATYQFSEGWWRVERPEKQFAAIDILIRNRDLLYVSVYYGSSMYALFQGAPPSVVVEIKGQLERLVSHGLPQELISYYSDCIGLEVTTPEDFSIYGDNEVYARTFVACSAMLRKVIMAEGAAEAWEREHFVFGERSLLGQTVLDWGNLYYEFLGTKYGFPRLAGKKALVDRGRRILFGKRMAKFRALGPTVFLPMIEMISGLRKAKSGAIGKACQHYKKAYDAAEEIGSVRDMALAAEYLFKAYNGRETDLALLWFYRAINAYRRYDYAPKLQQLQTEFPELLTLVARELPLKPAEAARDKHVIRHEEIDLETLIECNKILTGELRLEGLIDKSLAMILKNATATKVTLLLNFYQSKNLGDWLFAKSLGDNGEACDQESWSLPLKSFEALPDRDLAVVTRTNGIHIVNDCSDDADSGFYELRGIKSCLFLPLLATGNLVGILLIENTSVSHGFDESRNKFYGMLGAQIGNSLANAILYSEMEAKVEERARSLVTIMKNIEQGIFMIDGAGKVADEYSSALPKILGITQIAGRDALEILFMQANITSDAQAQVSAAIEVSIAEDIINFEANADMLIREFERRDDKTIEVDWLPIVDKNDIVQTLMVTLRDVTEVRAARKLVAESQKKLQRVSAIIGIEPRAFVGFMKDCNDRLAKCGGNLKQLEDYLGCSEANMRELHTIKGVARFNNFDEIASLVHEKEDQLRLLKNPAEDATEDVINSWHKTWHDAIGEVQELVDEFIAISEKEMHYSAIGDKGGVSVAELKIARSKQSWDVIDQLIAQVESLDLRDVLKPLIDSIPSLAAELGRGDIAVAINGDARVPNDWHSELVGVFSHIIRNNVDHGLKGIAEPQIEINIEVAAEALMVQIADSGKGLNLSAIEAKFRAEGSEPAQRTDLEIAELIFRSGVSTATAVSAISGRGVGMDAVRESLRGLGGDIKIEFVADRDAEGYRRHRFVVILPLRAAIDAPLQSAG